jgi:hypothetical protein
VDRAPARARERKRTRKQLDSGYEHVHVQGAIFHSLRYSLRFTGISIAELLSDDIDCHLCRGRARTQLMSLLRNGSGSDRSLRSRLDCTYQDSVDRGLHRRGHRPG